MIAEKRTISLLECFGVWLTAAVAQGLCIVLYSLFTNKPVSLSNVTEVSYFLQGSLLLLAMLCVLSGIGVDIRAAIRYYAGNFPADFRLALKYFLVYTGIIAGILLAISLVCFLLIKTGTIAPSQFLSFFNKPKEISKEHTYLLEIFRHSPARLAIYLFSTSILIPAEEEIIFRRLIYVSFRQRFAFTPALIVSSLIFSAVHLSGAVPAFAAGIFLGWIYEKRENLQVNMLVHGLINLSVTLLICLK
jgi:membrane protease YdiL (CAAX protease family)